MHATILFEPDGYMARGGAIMGRQAAGDGFLRAAVKAHGGEPLLVFTPHEASARVFRDRVAQLDPAARIQWIPAARQDRLADRGVLYRPDHALGVSAYPRLRTGVDGYGLCGVTHTLCSAGAMAQLTQLAVAPTAPWDAVVCTSSVAVTLVGEVLDAQAEYLAWRFGPGAARPPRPLLPHIPLGVHVEDFALADGGAAQARTALGIDADEVVALFAGRLSLNGKAHPFAMYRALQRVAETSGRRLTLIQAGRFPGADFERAYRAGAARFCPDVRCLFVDGEAAGAYRQAWAAADLFVSLADSLQETFGLTPVEAMARGLPVLVTDWNGYKDTVRDGVDGFRVPIRQPAPGLGGEIARDYEAGVLDYELFLSRTSTAAAVDMDALGERLGTLVTDGDLRRRMGEAGRQRAAETFDWSRIYPQYQALWAEQNAIRQREAAAFASRPGPTADPAFPDPFTAFGHYPSGWIGPDTVVEARPGADPQAYAEMAGELLFALWRLGPAVVARIFERLAAGPASVTDLAQAAGATPAQMAETVGRLAKMDLLAIRV